MYIDEVVKKKKTRLQMNDEFALQRRWWSYNFVRIYSQFVTDSLTSLCFFQRCPYKGKIFHILSKRHFWTSLQYEATVFRSPLTSPNRKQDFLLSFLSTDLYHHCAPHSKPHGPPGGYYPTKTPTSAQFSRPHLIPIYSGTVIMKLAHS